MAIQLTGSVTVDVDGEKIKVPSSEFEIAEDGNRNLGDGDRQYEVLFIYNDPDDRFKIKVQATRLGNVVDIYEASIEGDAEITRDNLDAKSSRE